MLIPYILIHEFDTDIKGYFSYRSGFRHSAFAPSCFFHISWTSSITRTDLVWIRTSLVPKGTSNLQFLQALENWNSSISKWRWVDLDRIIPGQFDRNVEMVSKKEQKDEMAVTNINALMKNCFNNILNFL